MKKVTVFLWKGEKVEWWKVGVVRWCRGDVVIVKKR